MRRPETILVIGKKTALFEVLNKCIIYKFSKVLLTTVIQQTRWCFLAANPSLTFLNTGTTDEAFQISAK